MIFPGGLWEIATLGYRENQHDRWTESQPGASHIIDGAKCNLDIQSC